MASNRPKMNNFTKTLVLTLVTSFLFSCGSQKITTDRMHFIQDGGEVPVVDMDYYRPAQERPHQDSLLSVALAISGGGSRAANFALGVMIGLENIEYQEEQDVLDQIDYLSTVSGGGFAGGAYVNALFEHDYFEQEEPFSLRSYWNSQIKKDLQVSYTGVLLAAKINPKYWFSYLDDGDALEKAINEHVLGYKRRKKIEGKEARSLLLGDLFIPKDSLQKAVKYPMHFTNSSVLKTWSIFPFAPDILDCYLVNGYTHRLRLTKEEKLDPFSVPLSVGIKASGSFPVLIANSTLHSTYNPKLPYLHILDGAMTDNTGYYTALEILKQERLKRRVLMIIDADAVGNRYTFSKRRAAASSFWVYTQLPVSGIDSRRVTLERDVETVCSKEEIQPIFFSFNTLIRGNAAKPPKIINKKTAMAELIQKMKTDLTQLDDVELQTLYELLVNIDTKYTITILEQDLLMWAGQKVVQMQEEKILKALR